MRIPMAAPSASARHDAAGRRRRTPRRTQAIAIAMNARKPWRTPQPIEPRSHSPSEQRGADDEQDATADDDERERDRAERRDPGDLAADRGRLGLGQLDMGHRQPIGRFAGRRELGAQARGLAAAWAACGALGGRWRPRRGRRRLAGRRRRPAAASPDGGGGGFGSSRVVLPGVGGWALGTRGSGR